MERQYAKILHPKYRYASAEDTAITTQLHLSQLLPPSSDSICRCLGMCILTEQQALGTDYACHKLKKIWKDSSVYTKILNPMHQLVML
jgi:hypothetical protein